MDNLLEALDTASAPDRDSNRPEFFRLTDPTDRTRLEELLEHGPPIVVHDGLHAQLTELVRTLHPSRKFTKADLDKAAIDHLQGMDPRLYGVWVYYPWSKRLVHLLDEEEFALVRTDRNRNKITAEEQALLATKKIGVIGLSVGQSVCLTLALERSFGELRIADFDTLDLSNLNRIRSGTHALGHRKTVNVAREIAELDPFLKVTLFSDGINENNIDDFLTKNGKLDLLIEECDSISVKIIARQRARSFRIPVVMDTSDRGLMDVERFDLEPDRPILHGLVDHLDPSLAGKARTNEEKLPFVVPIIGLDTMSTRMKASMLEIESSVGTWPQLASSVVLGGALVADVHRRIAIGTFTRSGRWFVDTEELVADERKSSGRTIRNDKSPLALETMLELAHKCELPPALNKITDDEARQLINAAITSPSAGNLQPWKVLHHEGRLLLFHDASLGDSELDPGRLIPSLDMGAFLESLNIKASELGIVFRTKYYPLADERCLVAFMEVAGATTKADPMNAWLGRRCSNRKKGNGEPIPRSVLKDISSAVSVIDGMQVHFMTERANMTVLAEMIAEAERIRLMHPLGHYELFQKEIRWDKEEATRTRDGLDLPTMELKLTEEVGFRVAADRKAIDLLVEWDAGLGFAKMTRENMAAASALALISAPQGDPSTLLDAGRAMQRLWLSAAQHQLAVYPCAAPILLAHPLRAGFGGIFREKDGLTLLRVHDELINLFAIDQREPVFMMRLSNAPAPSARSLRRPLGSFLFANRPQPA